MPDFQFKIINITISLIPLIFALFYPNIGTVLSYAASISGFFMIYVVPVMAYMKLNKIEIQHPLLADALKANEVDVVVPERARSTLPKTPLMSPKMN